VGTDTDVRYGEGKCPDCGYEGLLPAVFEHMKTCSKRDANPSDTDALPTREWIMERWDSWRKMIADGFKGTSPRDSFESILDAYDEHIATLTAERTRIRHRHPE